MIIRSDKWKAMGDCAVVYSDDYLNAVEGERLEDDCGELLKSGFRKVLIDFSRTELVNSIGISILIGIIEKVRESEGTLLFSSLRKTNVDAFKMLGLTKYVPIFETEEEALRSCNSTAKATGTGRF